MFRGRYQLNILVIAGDFRITITGTIGEEAFARHKQNVPFL